MAVDYNDKRLTQVEEEKEEKLNEVDTTYGDMISKSDQFYQEQIDASKDYVKQQQQLQQENNDFAIEQIEQQKQQAQKDYTKEQSAAYADWQKQSAKHGVNAEQMADMGMRGTGYSESAQVAMYNTYQNRVASARESVNLAIQNYNNQITQARLQNSSALAEIAYNGLQQQFQLALQGFQYKNSLILEQAQRKTEIDSLYFSKYQSTLDQINNEESLKLQREQFEEEKRQYNESLKLQKEQLVESKSQFDVGKSGSGLISKGGNDTSTTISTKYYNGTIAENVGGFGYMGKDNNGTAYQPWGVYINGVAHKLSKTGKKAKDLYGKNAVNSSGVNIANQNVWEAGGQKFIWNGTKNRYERVE